MSRQSSIATHPQREAIEKALATGVTGATIARQYGLSESAISRHRISRMDALAQLLDDDTPNVTDVMSRLLDVADDARQTRRLAATSGTPVTRARAQNAELAALEKIADRLGIDDTTAVRFAAGTEALVTALVSYLETHPDARSEWFALLGKSDDLLDLRDAIKTYAKRHDWTTA